MNKLVFILLFIPFNYFGQNLVPNHSFEEKVECPYHSFGSFFTMNWITANPLPFTYFNACDTNNLFSVPINAYGYGNQIAQDGEAYISVTTYGVSPGSPNEKSYAQVKLNQPLVSGKKYHWCFWVSLFDNSYYVSNNMGIALSSQLINSSNYDINITPVYNHNDIISETEEWVKLSGEFTASGGEEYLLLGNFYPMMTNTTVTLNSKYQFIAFDGSYSAIYYVDNVYLGERNKCSDAEPEIPNVFTPNGDGMNDVFLLDFPFESVKIYNRWGQLVFNTENNGAYWGGRMTAAQLVPNGTYYYIIKTEEKTYKGYLTLLR